MTSSLLLLVDIDGTLCPIGPGPGMSMRHLSSGAERLVRTDLPDVPAEVAGSGRES